MKKSIQKHTPGLNANESISKNVIKHKEDIQPVREQKRWIEHIKKSKQKHTPCLNANQSISKSILKHKENL